MDTSIAPAEILLAEELARDPKTYDTRCVRVTGKVSSIDPRENTARLCDGVTVDLALTGPVTLGSLFQFIGEVDVCDKVESGDRVCGVVLRARLARCVDGLDLGLFKEALRARREFLKKFDT